MHRVLVVDDEESLRRLVSATLESAGFRVLQAIDGPGAIETVRRERPSLVLLDVNMPGINGLEACRRIKSDPDLRGAAVVMLTASARPDVRSRAREAGADAFLVKPFSPLELLRLVHDRLASVS